MKKDTTLFTLEGEFERFSTRTRHAHTCHQLLRMRSGVSLLEEDACQQPLFSNMTALIPAGVAHRSLVLGGPVHYKSIYLDKRIWSAPDGTIRIFDTSPLGTALFDSICLGQEKEKDRDFHLKSLDLLLDLLAREMNRPSDITRIPLPRDPSNLKLTDFIKKKYKTRLGLTDFSQVVHYSPRHLSRRFKADLGISLFEYLKLYRIFRASVALSVSRESVAQIAFDVGYESLSSFYKDFKTLYASSPKLFRNQRSAEASGITVS